MSVKAILHPTDQLVAELNDRGSVNARAVYMEGVSMPGLSNGVSMPGLCQCPGCVNARAVKWSVKCLSNGCQMECQCPGCQMAVKCPGCQCPECQIEGVSMPGLSIQTFIWI